jgi:tyrosyl-tRNA synthetase
MTLFEELKARGIIAQMTDEAETAELINSGKATFYVGFDPTADSLHVGHAFVLTVMRRLQSAGNHPIALIGGGTTMVGDPSGRADMRPMLTKEQVAANGERFKAQIAKFIDFDKATMVNNADWLMSLNYIDMLRDVGTHFSVNNMLRAECYKKRMEQGLSFLEFNYMIMQSYDFYRLYQDYGCVLQCGGDDQWSNFLGGTELIRRKLGKNAYGLTITLLPAPNGEKMGKTAGNAVWLDPDKTSPYEFYQYWRNVDDSVLGAYLRMLTFLTLDEISELEQDNNPNKAKEILAFEMTKLIHSEKDAQSAQETSRKLFSGGVPDDMPTVELAAGSYTIIDLLVASKLCESNGDARRNIQQGGVYVNGAAVTDIAARFDVTAEGVILRKGKKKYARIRA